MKHLLVLLVFLPFSLLVLSPSRLFASSLEDSGVHRFATYNVRYVNSNNGDTGDKLWANRRDYVCQIVKDYDFDIVGMQEVTGNNQDPTTKKSQLQDINDRLSDYTCIAYEREDRQYSYNTVLYKTAKYECLDHCSFWLSPKPWSESSSAGWTGGDIARRCIVAHMRVKSTGEEFYFCCTHCNYAPNQAGIEGARVMHEEIPNIVGNKPVVLVGDFNMNRETHTQAYRAYASIFYEARVQCDSMLSLPITNPQVKYTNGFNWVVASQHPTGTTEFDHHFYARMQPLSYHIITEDYNRAITPSDHFPLLVRYRLLSQNQTHYAVADEASLNLALSQANHGDTILLDVDSLPLTESIRPACSICLMGKPTGTVLTLSKDGSIVEIKGSESFRGEHLIFKNVQTTSISGGAGIYTTGYDLFLSKCQFIHCQAPNGNGGAINATPHQIILDSCQFIQCQAQNGGACFMQPYSTLQINDCLWQDNTATKTAGGVYATFVGDCRVRHCVFDANTAAAGAAMTANGFDVLGVLNCSFTGNQSRQQGALWLSSTAASSKATVFQCTFLNNSLTVSGGLPTLLAKYGGAALKIQVPSAAQSQVIGVAHCTFINNNTESGVVQSKFTTAACDVEGGYVCMMNNWLLANRFQCTDYAGYNDVRTSGTINLWRNTYNLTTADSLIAGWKTNISACLEGQWQDSLYVPLVTNQYVYCLRSTTLGTYSLCNIPLLQRMCSSALGYNLTGEGADGMYVRYDQLGTWRDAKACYGSIEYIPSPAGMENVNVNINENRKVMRNGQIIINNHYTILGQSL